MGNLCLGVPLPNVVQTSSLETGSCWDSHGEIQVQPPISLSAPALATTRYALTLKAP